MVRNKTRDLTNILFEQLERISDPDLSEEELEQEIRRGEALTNVSKPLIEIANLSFKAKVKQAEYRGLENNESFLLE